MRSLAVAALLAAWTTGALAQAAASPNLQLSGTFTGLHTKSSREPSEAGGEGEIGIAAKLGPWLSGFSTLGFDPNEGASVEEAYVQTTSLGNGLTVKGGRFFSAIGYQNSQHAHVWDFVDLPLAYDALLGGQFTHDGAQVAWVAPTDTYFEVRAEAGRGRSLALHTGGDVGESSSWRAGVSRLDKGGTRVWVADGVWKWAPNGDARRTNFKLQGEYLRSTQAGGPAGSGWYVQGIYQFMRGWRVGLRTERLDAPLADPRTRRNSVMVDWSPDEFSRVRLQYAQQKVSLQYMISFGAHAAHAF